MSEQGSTGEAPGGAAAEAVAKRARSRQVRDKGLVEAARAGDKTAFGKLYDHWVDNVYDRAVNAGASAAEAREITEQTFLTAFRDLEKLKQPAAFGAKVLQVTRRETIQRVPDGPKTTSVVAKSGSSSAEERLSRATNAEATAADHDVAAVLREAATALDDRTREVLDLHFRQGLTRNETAAVLGDQPDKVTETVTKLPPALAVLTRARVLWHSGKPEDPELAEQLKADGVTAFNAAAVRSINRFAKDNDRARARSLIGIPPIELYAAIPLADAPAGMKMAVASTLVTEGVPMDGSAFVKRDDKGEIIDQPKRVSKTRDVGADKLGAAAPDRSIRPGLDEKRPTLDTKKAAAVAAAAVAAEKQALAQSATAPVPIVEEKPTSRKERKAAKAESARADEKAAAATAATAATAAAATAASEKDAESIASSRTPDEELPGRRDKDTDKDKDKDTDKDKGASGAGVAAAAAAGAVGGAVLGDAASAEAEVVSDPVDLTNADAAGPDAEALGDKSTDTTKAVDAEAPTETIDAVDADTVATKDTTKGTTKDTGKGTTKDTGKGTTKDTGKGTGAGAGTGAGTGKDTGKDTGKGAGKDKDKGTGKKVAAAAVGTGAAAALSADGALADESLAKAKPAAAKSKGAGTKPTPVATTSRTDEAEPGGAGKYIAAAAVVLLLIGGIAFALTRGGDKNVVAGPATTTTSSASTTTTTRPSSTTTSSTSVSTSSTEAPTTTAAGPSTTAIVTPTTSGGGGNPTVAPTTATTIATTTTTSQTGTIVIQFGLNGESKTRNGYKMTAAPGLVWNVTANGSFSVTITVTDPNGGTKLLTTDASGSLPKLCPGTVSKDALNQDICTVSPTGAYQYKILVHPADGSGDKVQAVGLTVDP